MAVAAESTAAAVEVPEKPKRQRIGKVLLNLENCILASERLSNTPSMQDGLDLEIETDLRFIGCELIQSAGILLRLPQVAMATGQVLYQRFYYSKSFVGHNFEIVAMACIVLASKIEEAPRRVRDVLNVFHRMEQMRKKLPAEPLLLDHQYMTMKNLVIKAERRVLKELGFCVHVKHPHKMIVTLLEVVLRSESNDRLVQIAWNYMNDGLRSDIFVRHTPETISCACIHLAARLMQIPLPNNPNWYEALRVAENDLQDAAFRILSIYARPKVDVDRVDKIVKDLRNKQEEEKKRKLAAATGIKIDMEGRENNNSNNTLKPSITVVGGNGNVNPAIEASNGMIKKVEVVKDEKSPPSPETKKDHRSRDGRDRERPREYRRNRTPESDRSSTDRSGARKKHKRRRDHSRSLSPDRRRRNRSRRSRSRSRDRRRDRR